MRTLNMNWRLADARFASPKFKHLIIGRQWRTINVSSWRRAILLTWNHFIWNSALCHVSSRRLYKGRLPISYQLIIYAFCDKKTFAVVVHTISLNCSFFIKTLIAHVKEIVFIPTLNQPLLQHNAQSISTSSSWMQSSRKIDAKCTAARWSAPPQGHSLT